MIPTFDQSVLSYSLPDENIALFPKEQRDKSKLLIVNPHDINPFTDSVFHEIDSFLPEHSLLIVNASKVIKARIYAHKQTGGKAELLLIEPIQGSAAEALIQEKESIWECMIGGKNLIPGTILICVAKHYTLKAEILERNNTQGIVKFQWDESITLGALLEDIGTIPLPPYLHRKAEDSDTIRYQTIYAKENGSVAAPTAGLHITDNVIQKLKKKQINILDITLHVGLGTFKPYEADTPEDFLMHTEKILIPKEVIEHCREFFLNPDRGLFISVGTTSCRTMESVFWFGVQLLNPSSPMWNQSYISMQQWTPYSLVDKNINAADVFAILLTWMDRYNLTIIEGETQLMIIPGYSFGITEALITNFHQPKSTLLFLVSAFLGTDIWKQSYEYALKNDYRFLSYGDSSLLLKGKIFHVNSKPVL